MVKDSSAILNSAQVTVSTNRNGYGLVYRLDGYHFCRVVLSSSTHIGNFSNSSIKPGMTKKVGKQTLNIIRQIVQVPSEETSHKPCKSFLLFAILL